MRGMLEVCIVLIQGTDQQTDVTLFAAAHLYCALILPIGSFWSVK